MVYFSICGLIGFLTGISCALFVFLSKPRTPIKILWSLYGLVLSFWGFGVFRFFTTSSHDVALFWGRACDHALTFIPVFFFHFVLLLTNSWQEHKKALFVYYTFCVTYFVTSIIFPQYFIPDVSPKLSFLFYVDAGPAFYVFTILFFYAYIHGLLILYRSYQKASAIRRNQYKYFAAATILAIGGASTSYFLVFNVPVFPFGVIMLPIHDLMIGYIIVKHHLMDIRVVIRKGLIYTMLATSVTLFYMAAVYSLEKVFHNVIGYHSLMGSIGVMVLIAFLFVPLKDHIQSFVDRYFFKASYAQMIEQNDLLRQQSIRAQRYQMMSALSLELITELRNPLTTLVGYDYHLPKKLNDQEFLNKFAVVYHRELQRLQGFIQQLSDFSEIKPLNLKNLDLTILMSELLEHLSDHFQQHEVKLYKYYSAESELMINADQEQLRRALYVFLSHSIKSTPAQGQVWVGMEENMEGVEISIKDTGKGLSQEDLSKIYDPLFSTSKSTGDTNVPLAQAQNIITQHGGKVMVDSQLNIGTEWIIQLPIVREF